MHRYPVYKPFIGLKEIYNVVKVIKSGWVSSLGKEIIDFEKKFANSVDCEFGISVSNATNGLHIVLASLGISEDDELIVPHLTFVATANAVKYTKAKLILCDVNTYDLNININCLKKLITSKTRVIMPVHLYGAPCNMDEILEIASKNDIFILEDSAESHFAKYRNKAIGSLGNASVFSFYGNKIITTGEGGMITTNDSKLNERLKFLRDHAMNKEKRYWHEEVGYNYRLTNIQASFGLAQLSRKKRIVAEKIKIFKWYESFLKDIENIYFNHQDTLNQNVYWLVNIFHPDLNSSKIKQIKLELNKNSIDIRELFYPISMQPPFSNSYLNKKTSNSHKIYDKGFSLPSYYGLSKNNVYYISKILKKILKSIL